MSWPTFVCSVIGSIALLASCSSDTGITTSQEPLAKGNFKAEKNIVQLATVSQGSFDLEILSTGKALAVSNADIRFALNENIREILVKNGDRVLQGQVLARLEDADLKTRLERVRESLEKATVELDDRLIDYGHRLKDSLKVTPDIMRMAKIKSGYNNARYDFEEAKTMLGRTVVVAPFAGKVANLEARIYNKPDAFKRLCVLIDDKKMLVEFNVLESEYEFVSKGSMVEVTSFGKDLSLKGIVTHVNPVIDGNGMVKVVAIVDNSGENLLDGMSVKVAVKKSIPHKIFVPKEAVVQRDNRQVVFTYEKGQAFWNYVETDLQNGKFMCILSGLRPNQQVIVSNNVSLAHGTEVEPDKSSKR